MSQNNLEEFYPYFSFLKVEHIGSFDKFKKHYCTKGDPSGVKRIQALLRKIMIRRTHLEEMFGKPILKLPGLNIRTIQVEFNDCERAIYQIIEDGFRRKIRRFIEQDSLDKAYTCILVYLLRLRQLVGHILLIQKTLTCLIEAEDLEKLWRLTETEQQQEQEPEAKELLVRLRKILIRARETAETQHPALSPSLSTLQISSSNPSPERGQQEASSTQDDIAMDLGGQFGLVFKFRNYLATLKQDQKWEAIKRRSICYRCSSPPENPYVTSCFHLYCKNCLDKMLDEAPQEGPHRARCLACSSVVEQTSPCYIFGEAQYDGDDAPTDFSTTPNSETAAQQKTTCSNDEEEANWILYGDPVLPSAKTLGCKAQILNWFDEDPSVKVIVFTQFRGMIQILGRICKTENWGYVEFHGLMTHEARQKAISEFSDDPGIRIMLASMKAGGVGLNLTMASKVIIMDLWWNDSVELQAFCRCYRIGQKKPVDVVRLVVKNSIDEKLRAMQAYKKRQIDSVMDKDQHPHKLTIDELIKLFEPVISGGGEDQIGHDFGDERLVIVDDEIEGLDQGRGADTTAQIPSQRF